MHRLHRGDCPITIGDCANDDPSEVPPVVHSLAFTEKLRIGDVSGCVTIA